jgi:hypothetical protein
MAHDLIAELRATVNGEQLARAFEIDSADPEGACRRLRMLLRGFRITTGAGGTPAPAAQVSDVAFDRWWTEQVDSGAAECSTGMARAVWDAAVAAERERCLAAVAAVQTEGLRDSPDGWDFYGEWACAEIEKRIREEAP